MINTKQHVKRYEGWKRNISATSMFVVICGFIAMIYFLYRVVLIASPIVAIEQSIFNPTVNAQVVCQEDEGSKLSDPLPLLSAAYQDRIQRQKAVGPNIVTNSDLSQINSETNSPIGYSHNIDDADAVYEYITDPADTTTFLRVTNKRERVNQQSPPSWQMDPVALSSNPSTYAYSFKYRSPIPVHVSLEYTVGGQTFYSDVMTLDPTGTDMSWRPFTAHFDNVNKATTLRVDLNGVGIGSVDSKDFDVHLIPDAKLKKGIVSVTFDDGWRSVNDHAFSLFEKYNIHTTQYIISEAAEHKVAGYMNYGMIEKLKAAGHEIGSHSLNHCNQTELPPDSLQNNVLKSKQALEQRKLGPIKTFAYPLGQYDKKTQAVYQKEYPLIRTSDAGYNDRYYDETNIHSMSVESNTSDAAFRAWLTYAKKHHQWVVLVYHRIDESGDYNVTSEQLERQLKIINESGLSISPMSEAGSLARK